MSANGAVARIENGRVPEPGDPGGGPSIDTLKNIKEALALRKQGVVYWRIAQEMGLSETRVRDLVRQGLEMLHEDIKAEAKEMLDLSMARLDDMLYTVYPRAKQGRLKEVDRVIKIEVERSRMAGYAAPSKFAPIDPSSEQEYGADADAIREELRARLDRVEAEVQARAEENTVDGEAIEDAEVVG